MDMALEAGNTEVFIHPEAVVEEGAEIGPGCFVWRNTHVRAGARIQEGSKIGADVFIDAGVVVGPNCKIQNAAQLFEGVVLEAGVFVGPLVCFTNDRLPRAVNPDLSLKRTDDWTISRTLVGEGAAVGASSVVVAGITIGAWALVGAGSVVTRDVPPHALVRGNPARLGGWVCRCARRLEVRIGQEQQAYGWCSACHCTTALPADAHLEPPIDGRQG